MVSFGIAKLGDASEGDIPLTGYLGTAAVYTEQDFVTMDGSLVLVIDSTMTIPNYSPHGNTAGPPWTVHTARKIFLPTGVPLVTIQMSPSTPPLPVAKAGDIIWDPNPSMGGIGSGLCYGDVVGAEEFVTTE